MTGIDSTASREWKHHSTKWNYPTTKDHWHRTTEREDSKRATTDDEKRVDWRRVTESDVWKEYHSSNNAATASSVLGLISSFVVILFFRL